MENEESKNEPVRQLIDQALGAGRMYQSDQTGFIHYNHSHMQSTAHQTIPIYENALFALALFRTRLMDQIKEGQALISRLLAFQTNQGNFPVYLHEFPHCRDFSLGVQLLAPFYWIKKGYGHVLPQDLKGELNLAVTNMMNDALEAHQKTPFPFSLAVRFSAGLIAFGNLGLNPEWSQRGKQMLTQLMGNMPDLTLHSTAYLADLLVALQMTGMDPQDEPWNSMWIFLGQSWHHRLGCYCGPVIREIQDREEPVTNLYDFYLGVLTGIVGKRTHSVRVEHLKGALVYPFSFPLPVINQPHQLKGKHGGHAWSAQIENDWGLALMDKPMALSENRERTFTPLRLIWGTKDDVHSLVCQGTKAMVSFDDSQIGKKEIDLYYQFDYPFEGGNSEKSREICFYFDLHPEVKVMVEGSQATTFVLGQKVTIQLGNGFLAHLQIDLLEGSGDFLGHIAQANRPSQMNQGEDKRFEVYDWTLFLRTLRRGDQCKIRARLELCN